MPVRQSTALQKNEPPRLDELWQAGGRSTARETESGQYFHNTSTDDMWIEGAAILKPTAAKRTAPFVDLRWSLLKMARTHDIATISKLTGVGKHIIERLMSDYRKYGTAARWGPDRSLRGQKRTLSTQNVKFLRGYIRFRNDPYLQELKDALEERVGVEVSDMTITRHAIERNEGNRRSYKYDYGRTCQPETTVFVDESSFDRRTVIRNRGWALRERKTSKDDRLLRVPAHIPYDRTRAKNAYLADTFVYDTITALPAAASTTQESALPAPKWRQVLTHGFLTYRCQAQLVCDPDTGRTYLFGGFTNNQYIPARTKLFPRSFGGL
ncbi:hypothetical protein DFH09DRAFT_1106159 [Mycena vulgaris]|nr:hypothetical protein DFH09DRAFT_1106159 [Mycena vulgaris]